MASRLVTFTCLCFYFSYMPECLAFWDDGTSTPLYIMKTPGPRVAFFQWEKVELTFGMLSGSLWGWIPDWNRTLQEARRSTQRVAGMSIGFQILSVAAILNHRTLLTGANFLEPYLNRMRDVRIWALGRSGYYLYPWRYRVWRWRRIFPRSMNAEHQHGARGRHTPRHNLAVVHSWDQMYVVEGKWNMFNFINYMYAIIAKIAPPLFTIKDKLLLVQAGLFDVTSAVISPTILRWELIINCEKYLPKWWGKFICIQNIPYRAKGVLEGDALLADHYLVGVGCFEIRYNDDRILVFTDIRYYYKWIHIFANITKGEYYEYAYPQWGVDLGWTGLVASFWNSPQIPNTWFQTINLAKWKSVLGK